MGKFDVGSCRHSLGPTRSSTSRSGGGSDAVAFARMADIGWHQRLKLQAPTKESRNLDGTNWQIHSHLVWWEHHIGIPKNKNRSSGDWILQDDDVSLGATWAVCLTPSQALWVHLVRFAQPRTSCTFGTGIEEWDILLVQSCWSSAMHATVAHGHLGIQRCWWKPHWPRMVNSDRSVNRIYRYKA